MKVLLDLQYLNVATTGIKTYMMELAKAAIQNPHPEIEWIFSHDPDEQAKDNTHKSPKNKFQRLNYHLDYFRWKEFQLPDMIKKHKPDLLICPDFVSPAAKLPCKRMTVIHDAFFWEMPQNYPKWWRTYFLGLVRKGLKEPTEIVTTTEFSKKALIKHLKTEHPISVIYQTPKSLGTDRDSSILERYNIGSKAFFLHLGTFDKRKNLPILVNAFKEAKEKEKFDFKLVLAGGEGQSIQMNDFPIVENLVKELGLQDEVVLPGFVSDAEANALYENAYAYVFPSENEGFGIPVLEAMAAGVPVIHSDQPALVEVSKGAGLIAKTGSVTDLREKMILLAKDENLRNDLKKRGLERANDFGPGKFIKAFQELILSARP
ncbi:glycosyltransferase family 4 protein [Algoriphagus sediminis]|uniref:Glycosyltransferase family 1 protein n=1 Tax=Algoriphagus sediminis TaxID=3057113 RepID=A0ABT7YCC5_9BACT|nr:glycosyltransferase family 1 protein [Algoriphagus sediminis]MDN3204151.1 glycosyltransferase family 1 protein [Algoriphagus sediminis]